MVATVEDCARRRYVEIALQAYRRTRGTHGRISAADRALADRLYKRRVTLSRLQAALDLVALRRALRTPNRTPLQPIFSLRYFLPAIDELADPSFANGYFQHLEKRRRQLLDPRIEDPRRELETIAARKC